MRKFIFATVAVAALSLLAATPRQAKASWLSEYLHARLDPTYGAYGPGYGYYGYQNPGYDSRYNPSISNYYAPDYSHVPYYGPDGGYVTPYRGYYYRPRVGNPWQQHEWREHERREHEWRERH